MNFTFEVGEEKHLVEFYFNQIWGNLKITVDGHSVVTDFRLFSLNLVKKYEFYVGRFEKHLVRIEKERKLFFAGFRKQKYRIFVDDNLIGEHEGF